MLTSVKSHLREPRFTFQNLGHVHLLYLSCKNDYLAVDKIAIYLHNIITFEH